VSLRVDKTPYVKTREDTFQMPAKHLVNPPDFLMCEPFVLDSPLDLKRPSANMCQLWEYARARMQELQSYRRKERWVSDHRSLTIKPTCN